MPGSYRHPKIALVAWRKTLFQESTHIFLLCLPLAPISQAPAFRVTLSFIVQINVESPVQELGGAQQGPRSFCDASYLLARLLASEFLSPDYSHLWWLFSSSTVCMGTFILISSE
jgi:hypothetical protein